MWYDAGTGSLTVLKRTTSAGSCGGPTVVSERSASVIEQVKAEIERPADRVDDARQTTSAPPVDSTAALRFCSERLVNLPASDVDCDIETFARSRDCISRDMRPIACRCVVRKQSCPVKMSVFMTSINRSKQLLKIRCLSVTQLYRFFTCWIRRSLDILNERRQGRKLLGGVF